MKCQRCGQEIPDRRFTQHYNKCKLLPTLAETRKAYLAEETLTLQVYADRCGIATATMKRRLLAAGIDIKLIQERGLQGRRGAFKIREEKREEKRAGTCDLCTLLIWEKVEQIPDTLNAWEHLQTTITVKGKELCVCPDCAAGGLPDESPETAINFLWKLCWERKGIKPAERKRTAVRSRARSRVGAPLFVSMR